MDINHALLWVQTGTLIAIVLTLVVYYRQLRTMQAASRGQHFLALVQFLQTEEVRSARRHVLIGLKKKDFSNWNELDCHMASTVCASYGNAGVLVRVGLVDFSMLESWGPSVKRCFEVCQPLIKEQQKIAGPKYWIDFEKLNDLFSQSE